MRPWVTRAVSSSPPLPPPVLHVLASLVVGEMSFEQLRPVLDSSEALKARVLALVNSASYSPAYPIHDVRHASVILGQRRVLGLTLAHSLGNTFQNGASVHGHDKSGLMTHSLATATTAWVLGDMLGLSNEEGGTLYVAGIFHDAGKAVIAQYLRIFNCPIDFSATPVEAPGLASLEQECLGMDHAEVSVMLGRHWGLSEEVLGLIENHHQPGLDLLPSILHIADYLTSGVVGAGFSQDNPAEAPPDTRSLEAVIQNPDHFVAAEQFAFRECALAKSTMELLL